MAILNDEQGAFDDATQDEQFAPWHAMRRRGQSPEDARNEANDFIRNRICTARMYEANGFDEDAMRALSQAIHTMQDSTSPAHFGFQEAWPNTFLDTILNAPHYYREAFDPGAGSVADFQTAKAWGYFTGDIPMPVDFFVDNYHDGKSGWADYFSSFGKKTGSPVRVQ
jgi:hypothetical protein